MKLGGFFDDLANYQDIIKRYTAEIEARYQARIADFLKLKDELYTLRNILNVQGYQKNSTTANTYLARCAELIEEQLRLEASSVNVISTVANLKGSDLYNRVLSPSGDLLNDAAYYVQAGQLVRDAGALLTNWNTVNDEMTLHVKAVQSFSDEVRSWLGLPKNMLSAFPWNTLILPAGIIVGFVALGAILRGKK